MKRQYFGTDGVRGPVDGPVVNEDFARRLGAAAGAWVGGAGRVLVGRDTRASGARLTLAVCQGLASAGLAPVMIDVVPTPAVALAVGQIDAVLGVMVTASHNPASDNGIKFFQSDGTKLSDGDELAIERLIPASADSVSRTDFPNLHADAVTLYLSAMTRLLPVNALDGWSIVLDTANGATCETSSAVLSGMGASLIQIGAAPDGRNINEGVGSEHPEQLAQRVIESGARLGIAHDGDGDRCILCDETGHVLDGDEILTVLGLYALARQELPRNTLVVTVQSNLGVDQALGAAGGKVERTNVGDRYVAARMRELGAGLGGESSGHIISSLVGPTGDGLGAALLVLRVMSETGEPLSKLRRGLQKFPQATSAIKVAEKRSLDECDALQGAMRELSTELGSHGRLLVRFSGTEAKLRLLVEASTMADAERGLRQLRDAAVRDLVLV